MFERCVFANNVATTGIVGSPGADGPGNALADPYPNPAGPGASGSVTTYGTVAGGAVYQNGSSLKFIDCTFTENSTYVSFTFVLITGLAMNLEDQLIMFSPGGAVYATQGSDVFLKGCTLTRNRSDAIHLDRLGCLRCQRVLVQQEPGARSR